MLLFWLSAINNARVCGHSRCFLEEDLSPKVRNYFWKCNSGYYKVILLILTAAYCCTCIWFVAMATHPPYANSRKNIFTYFVSINTSILWLFILMLSYLISSLQSVAFPMKWRTFWSESDNRNKTNVLSEIDSYNNKDEGVIVNGIAIKGVA